MIGTFSPQPEPYDHEMHEETTPSGIFARGSYTARSKVSSMILTCQWISRIMSTAYFDWIILLILIPTHLDEQSSP